ncbi:AraC family transcriptional regulator [Burkholderia cepacia]|uniref:SDR family NAD(P)-dependent oxidoreductase n=1 Tax=Burkholderia cepacia TaxID=292 RepID=UPI0007587068|nr:SDR family oxidoreductase [Burkholderia cepacia]KVV53942.1 AraC family transcriptional regulator [Burkholderia cepacia]KVV62518.1 AraC family transcriptional regulator [Burkholderia cepacia]KVV68087.1 AraC family transcriptional regulator [Burkholderia cepacia]KVV75613.1 AraC family transcriptional regulator [Burkholderia cepacia]KVV79274.1 AraC family transcriptional regulator [Burkholderia cepacia]
MTTSTKGTALITGASAGIGAVYADRLAKRGYDLVLVARNQDRLNTLARRLMAETGRSVETVAADLNDKAALAKIEGILRENSNITMLVNNAGIGSVASILNGDVDTMESMINLNITALTRLTYAVAPVFASKGTGTIINISSVVGIAVELLNGVYSASKSYVLSFGHTLQRDLADKGVRVQTVLPAATATEFWDVAGYAKQKEAASTMTADDLVDAALAGLDQGELVTIPTLHDGDGWTQWEAARRALTPQFANAKPAPRYVADAGTGA